MRKCRFCGKEVQNASTVCEHCGRSLIPGRTAALPTPDDVLNELEHTPPPTPLASPMRGVPPPTPITPALVGSDSRQPTSAATLVRVSVVDVDMPFGSMVTFMVKWALAAIPAFLILGFIGAVVVAVFAAFGSALGGTRARAVATEAPAAAVAPISRTRARQLRGFSYSQVVTTLGQPSSQQPGVLIYRATNGDELLLGMDNDHVATAEPSDFDLTRIARPR